jgi:hypothetical protein
MQGRDDASGVGGDVVGGGARGAPSGAPRRDRGYWTVTVFTPPTSAPADT